MLYISRLQEIYLSFKRSSDTSILFNSGRPKSDYLLVPSTSESSLCFVFRIYALYFRFLFCVPVCVPDLSFVFQCNYVLFSRFVFCVPGLCFRFVFCFPCLCYVF